MTDWRDAVLADVTPLNRPGTDRPGSTPASGDAVRVGAGRIGDADVVVAVWDFSVYGGSFGEHDASLFALACNEAAASGRPLVSLVRSGGTRLQEGMRALVGIPRALLALDRLAESGVGHVAVVDHPTTGGVWVAVGARADVRIGVAGATVGFSGPRVIEAMTGVAIGPGANTAESAGAAGLLDAVLRPDEVVDRLAQVVAVLQPDDPVASSISPSPVGVPDRTGWEQVLTSRNASRPDGVELLAGVLADPVALAATDDSTAAAVGRLGGRRVVAAAVAAHRDRFTTVAGYRLLTRAAELAGRWGVGLVLLVDTAGADPLPASEQGGVAGAIADAARAVLGCAGPTLSVVHGAGGSGGALAAAVTDLVAVTEHAWFAALGPEGAAAALRRPVEQVVEQMGITPRELLASGFADTLAPGDAGPLAGWLAARLESLHAVPRGERLAARRERWSAPLPGSPRTSAPDPPDIA
ncbi:MAG TPA: carboxyl transferase domain-containing protein [Mycobacteriales bacterium]|nr:carboxyl transferase domain-containing protein [Mycobacteriales bacterium]